jgi:hypothetical protein
LTQCPVLKEGVLAKTNGIGLLKVHGFDDELEANAVKVFEWLSRYLGQPVGDARVLADTRIKVVRSVRPAAAN